MSFESFLLVRTDCRSAFARSDKRRRKEPQSARNRQFATSSSIKIGASARKCKPRPLVWYEGSGTTDRRFLSSDERGSIISVTDSSGALIGLNRYDEYGNPQGTNLGAFGYTGQAWLPELGAWYYKARVFDPVLGRFLQPDPIGYADSPNLYAYVLNDPVNLTDPLGLGTDDIVIIAKRLYTDAILRISPARVDRTDRGSGGGAGDDDDPIVITAKEPKKLSQCMISFLNSQGLTDASLRDVVFVGSMNASWITQKAQRANAAAITRGNTIFVNPDDWDRVTRPARGSTYFEEILHTIQYNRSGSLAFEFQYVLGSALAWLGGIEKGYPNHIEIEAKGFANRLYKNYLRSGRKC